MNKLLEKNISVLKDLSLKSVFENYSYIQQPILTQTNGYNVSYNGINLHNENSPLQEAKNIFSALKNDENSIHVIYGLGLGYMLQIASLASKGTVLLYEPNLDILYNAFSLIDFSADLVKDNVYIFTDFDKLQNFLSEISTNNSHVEIASLPTYRELYKDIFSNQIKKLELVFGSVILDYSYAKKKLYPVTRNMIRNIPELLKEIPINKLENHFKGKTAIVVSAGPTLAENIDILKENKDKAVILCVGTALKTLINNGITPDFLCIVEANNCSKQIDGIDLSDINLIVEPFTHSAIHSLSVKNKFLHVSSNMPPSEYWGKISDTDTTGYLTQGTVSYMTLNTAVKLGCSKVILVGQDLAYIDGQCYSKDSAYSELVCRFNEQTKKYEIIPKDFDKYVDSLSASEDVEQRRKTALERLNALNNSMYTVRGITGSDVPTETGYAAFIKQFADYAKSLEGVELINTSMKGALIEGFKNIPLKDAMAGLEKFDKTIPNVQATYDVKKVSESLSKLIVKLEEYEKLAIESGKVVSRLSMDWKRKRNVDKDILLKIRSLLEVYYKMNDSIQDNDVFRDSTAEAEMALNSFMKTVKTYDVQTTPEVINKLGEYYIFLQKRLKTVLYWVKTAMDGVVSL